MCSTGSLVLIGMLSASHVLAQTIRVWEQEVRPVLVGVVIDDQNILALAAGCTDRALFEKWLADSFVEEGGGACRKIQGLPVLFGRLDDLGEKFRFVPMQDESRQSELVQNVSDTLERRANPAKIPASKENGALLFARIEIDFTRRWLIAELSPKASELLDAQRAHFRLTLKDEVVLRAAGADEIGLRAEFIPAAKNFTLEPNGLVNFKNIEEFEGWMRESAMFLAGRSKSFPNITPNARPINNLFLVVVAALALVHVIRRRQEETQEEEIQSK